MNPQTTLEDFLKLKNKTAEKPKFEEIPREIISEMTKIYNEIFSRTHNWNSFEKSLEVFLAVLHSWKDDQEYLKIIKDLDKQTVHDYSKIFGLLIKHFCYDQNFADILGPVYMQVRSMGHRGLGQFFTPWHVAYMMAQMSGTDGKRINDPCCGSGVMLLAAKAAITQEKGRQALREYEFYGTDIDRICINMCKIQMLLTDDWHMTNLLWIKFSELFEKKPKASE